MRIKTKKTQFSYNADTYIVTGLQAAGETKAGLIADVAGTLGVTTFNPATGLHTSTATKAAITTNNPKFNLSYKDGDGNIVTLAEMSKDEIIVEKKAYNAPVKQVTAIGYNGTTGSLNYTTVVAGDEAIIRFVDTTETGAGLPYDVVLSYQYIAKPNDTPTTIIDALVAQINDVDSFQHKRFNGATPYVATALTGGGELGISLTTTEFGETFSVATDGVFQYATQTDLVNYSLGNGVGTEVAYLEEITQYTRGNGWRNEDSSSYYPTTTKLANPALFYTRYKITNKPSTTARRDRFKTNIWIYVAQTNAATPSTLLDLLLP